MQTNYHEMKEEFWAHGRENRRAAEEGRSVLHPNRAERRRERALARKAAWEAAQRRRRQVAPS